MVPFDNKFADSKPSAYGKILIVIASGLILAFGGCGLFAVMLITRHEKLSGVFAVVFALGALMLVVGVFVLAGYAIFRAFSKNQG